ncbi:MAG: hypothetical protein ACK5K7_02485 [Bacilli bacterium]
MKSRQKKIGIAILAVVVLFVGIRFFSKDNEQEIEIEIFSSLSEGESTVVYSNDSNGNSFYFFTAIKDISITDVEVVPSFDKEVLYEISYERVKSRASLPIEYYLASETDFDFEYLDEFKKYLSDRKNDEEYEENEQYETYIKDYGNNKYYKEFMKGFSIYMVEVKIVNPTQQINLNSISLVEKMKEDSDLESENSNELYRVETNIVYMNTPSNSSGLYTITNSKYENAKYYDNNIKYSFSISCNTSLVLNNFAVTNYDEAKINAYKSGKELKNDFSCSAGEVIDIDAELNIEDNKFFDETLVINFDANWQRMVYYTPQIFAPKNYMLIKEENLNNYSNYFEYTYSD